MKPANTDTEKEKKIGMFDVINMIEGAKIPWKDLTDDYKKSISQFMINRFVSSKELYLPLLDKVSTMKLSDEQYYELLCSFIDNKRKHYFDYKAYKKDKKDDATELLVYAYTKEYECGNREAKREINKLSEEVKSKLKSKWQDVFDSLNK